MQTKTLLASIFELMDFNPAITSSEMCLEEFRAKYQDSYISLDGEPLYLSTIRGDYLSGLDNAIIKYSDKHEIKNLSLKPGLYITDNKETLFYVYKFPSKQFCKGLKFGQTHNMKVVAGRVVDNTLNISFIGYTCVYTDKVFIYDKQIGTIQGPELILIDKYKHLKQECEELWKQYKII